MLKTNGTGNFSATNDGNGSNAYNGYMYANELTNWVNSVTNIQMNIPTGNSTLVKDRRYSFLIDAVYFWKNDATYEFETINTSTQGRNLDSVLNIFLSYEPNGTAIGGYANTINPNSSVKYTEMKANWQAYVNNINIGDPYSWIFHRAGTTTNHELGHLLGLSHTVMIGSGPPCNTGCPPLFLPIIPTCVDGCDDTPTAWDIHIANGCTKHPACGWNNLTTDCSNNFMDYGGANAMTPCQRDIVHTSLQGGMKDYTVCAAVSLDLPLCDIGYPKLSYFGKKISIGCAGTEATMGNENIKLYFSESVELKNFSITAGSNFEMMSESVCTF